MSTKYPGGLITKTPVTPTGPYENGAAPGVWTVDQALQYTKQGIWPTAGNQDPTNIYIEYLFSTYLLTETSQSMSVVNGVDLSGKGGMVWAKNRTDFAAHAIWDTARGRSKNLIPSNTSAQTTSTAAQDLISFNSNGFTLGAGYNTPYLNGTGAQDVFWTFREQAKFFDVVTYTGDGTSSRGITHALTSVPGMVMIKRTDSTGGWATLNRFDNTEYRIGSPGYSTPCGLNYTAALLAGNITTYASSTVFNVGSSLWGATETFNTNGATYVAYLFAHNAGGFGASGTDNVISCGSFTTDGSGLFSVTLGYEPQWVMVKRATGVGDWIMFDTMRGMPTAAASGVFSATLLANTSAAEDAAGGTIGVNSTGFNSLNGYLASSSTFIYIAIRRGPMQTPTVGTSVFTPQTWTGTGTNSRVFTGSGFPLDVLMIGSRDAVQFASYWFTDRLQGASPHLQTASTSAAFNTTSYFVSKLDSMDGYVGGTLDYDQANNSGSTRVQYFFRRAPGFLDEVCYTGDNASSRTITHNLGVVPEMMIVRRRSGAEDWGVYTAATGNTGSLRLNTSGAFIVQSVVWNNTTPTASVFTVGSNGMVNAGASTYVAYLFATLAGVSKVGGYTGTGAAQTINCGFTTGARFVLIKRSDSTGDWYVWDSARGIIPSNDPYLFLNSTAAEVTGTDYVDTTSVGFDITSTAPAAINANGGTFIFLAIA